MVLYNTSSRYGTVARAFHWVTVVLVLAAYLLSKGDPYSLYSAAADGTRRIHETLGMLVFIAVLLRLLWRLVDSAPAMDPASGWFAAMAAKLMHIVLYTLLVLLPLTAVLGTWLEGLPLTFPGFDVTPRIAQARGLGQIVIEIHSTLGRVILCATGVHAAAALFHHFCLRDGVLKSMGPGR